jgi:hypothetical protein
VAMLQKLSGRDHTVLTGMCLYPGILSVVEPQYLHHCDGPLNGTDRRRGSGALQRRL